MRRLLWPSLTGGRRGPSGWCLYDGQAGRFRPISADGLQAVEADLRAAGENEMAEAFHAEFVWLKAMALRWAEASLSHAEESS